MQESKSIKPVEIQILTNVIRKNVTKFSPE